MGASANTILFVAGADEWYGSDYVLYEIVRSLEGTEFNAMVLLPDDVVSELSSAQRLSGRLRTLGVSVRSLPLTVLRRRYMNPWGAMSLALRAPGVLRGALKSIECNSIALVHSHTATVQTGAAIARKLNVPHLWHVSEIVERPGIVRRKIARSVVRSADSVVAVSQAVKRHIMETEPDAAGRIDVIYNGLDATRFMAASTRRNESAFKVVGMLGRVGTWKGQELFLGAARLVAAAVPHARFVLAGGVLDGNTAALERLRALSRDYGIDDKVEITEYCEDTAALLSTLAVFVQPSLRPDPLPTTILEAMASGCPVVATRHGGAPEMVVDAVTGHLTPPGDEHAMAHAIISLLRDSEKAREMGMRGRERVERSFSPEAFREAYLAKYRLLVQKRR